MRLLINALLIVSLCSTQAQALLLGCGPTATCQIADQETTVDESSYYIGADSNHEYLGTKLNTNYTSVCSFVFNVGEISGTIAGKTYYFEEWTVDGSNSLVTKQQDLGSIAGSSVALGWNTITVANLNLTSGRAIVIHAGAISGAYIRVTHRNANSVANWTSAFGWKNDKTVQFAVADDDFNFKISTMQ